MRVIARALRRLVLDREPSEPHQPGARNSFSPLAPIFGLLYTQFLFYFIFSIFIPPLGSRPLFSFFVFFGAQPRCYVLSTLPARFTLFFFAFFYFSLILFTPRIPLAPVGWWTLPDGPLQLRLHSFPSVRSEKDLSCWRYADVEKFWGNVFKKIIFICYNFVFKVATDSKRSHALQRSFGNIAQISSDQTLIKKNWMNGLEFGQKLMVRILIEEKKHQGLRIRTRSACSLLVYVYMLC